MENARESALSSFPDIFPELTRTNANMPSTQKKRFPPIAAARSGKASCVLRSTSARMTLRSFGELPKLSPILRVRRTPVLFCASVSGRSRARASKPFWLQLHWRASILPVGVISGGISSYELSNRHQHHF